MIVRMEARAQAHPAAAVGTDTGTAAPTPQPTPRELAREAFVGKFSGKYAVGPPRFTDQNRSFLILAPGTSSAFLHGTALMKLYTPADPSGTVTGTATLFVKNFSNTGNSLAIDLQGDPTAVDRAGRPTLLTWTVNGNSGGFFAGATGQGTVAIHYAPDGSGRLHIHGHEAGAAFVIFHGQVVTTGTSNSVFAL
jgi:hypothetical protein